MTPFNYAGRAEAEQIAIPRPNVPFGPEGVTPEQADVDYLPAAARTLEHHYKSFGANPRVTVVKLIQDAADAVETARVHLAQQEPTDAAARSILALITPYAEEDAYQDAIDDAWGHAVPLSPPRRSPSKTAAPYAEHLRTPPPPEGPTMGFWTQPIGKTLAERKGGTSYQQAMLNEAGDGYLNLAFDGSMKYVWSDRRIHKEKFHITDVAAVSVGTEESYHEHTSLGRVAAGAVVGAVLLGPLGAVLGGGVGAVKKKGNLPAEYLLLELRDGRAFSVGVSAKNVAQGRTMRDAILAGMEPTEA